MFCLIFFLGFFTDPDLPERVLSQLQERQAAIKQNKVLQKTMTQ